MICSRTPTTADLSIIVPMPCPDCGHLLALHMGTDACPVCLVQALRVTLPDIDRRLLALERDEGIRLL
jgi:hypothetical protein